MTQTLAAYERVLQKLRELVIANEYNGGQRLPSESELCTELGVSRVTVRRAYQQLVAEGVVWRHRGLGTFVRPTTDRERNVPRLQSYGTIDEFLSLNKDSLVQMVTTLKVVTNAEAAHRLQLRGIEVATVEVIRYLREEPPYAFQRIHFPPKYFGSLQEIVDRWLPNEKGTFVSHLDQMVDGGVAGAEQEITATGCPADIAPRLDCSPGDPVLVIDRIYWDRDGTPIELVNSCYHPDRHSYRVELARTMSGR